MKHPIASAALMLFVFLLPCAAQPRQPNVEAQRAAMKKLDFLLGKWSGEARVQHGPGEPLLLTQTEEVQYKLEGLLLLIEGTGRNKSDGKTAFRALGVISFDDAAGVYRFRAYNDGRQVDTELKLTENGKGFTWGLDFGQVKTRYLMTLNDKGEWTETGELLMGDQPPRKFIEMTVRPQK